MADPRLVWLRRDLRLSDHPALAAAAASGPVVLLFVLDPAFFDGAGAIRQGWLAANLLALRDDLGGRLCLRRGAPELVVPALAAEVGATEVHVSAETEPAGRARDDRVQAALVPAGVAWVATGSPYAVTPGRVRNRDGGGFAVFTAFHRAWREHGWRGPALRPDPLETLDAAGEESAWRLVEKAAAACPIDLPPAGEAAARRRWQEFLGRDLLGYATARDRPDLDATSRLSAYLKFGVVHPRTLLADLAERPGPDADRFATELAWREFYADVLFRQPASATTDLKPLELAYDPPGSGFEAWRQGRTGFPIVDAGMRQLLAEGWMHNRVRMITASFLTKDLHHWWPVGAEHFLDHLIDGDLASNAHGWQWTAGTGTDAAPYFRVFNPTTQGRRFDPSGDYVRRWVPELRHLAGGDAHEPWSAPDGYRHGYPRPILDHASERLEALARYRAARG